MTIIRKRLLALPGNGVLLAANMDFILISTYEENGANPELFTSSDLSNKPAMHLYAWLVCFTVCPLLPDSGQIPE